MCVELLKIIGGIKYLGNNDQRHIKIAIEIYISVSHKVEMHIFENGENDSKK